MFNGDRLNDDYEQHQRRFALLMKDELDILIADAHPSHLHWYNGFLANIGEGLIATGNSLKERNSGVNTTRSFQPYGE